MRDGTPPSARRATCCSTGRSTRQRAISVRAARMERAAGRRIEQQTAAGPGCPRTCPSARATAGSRSAAACTGCSGSAKISPIGATSTSSPGVHHAEPIDELGHQAHVVADQHDRRAEVALHAAKRVHHLALDDDVERAGRLVGDDHLGRRQIAMAMQTRCFMPPLSSCGYLSATSGAAVRRLEQLARRDPRTRVATALDAVVVQRVDDLVADAHDRVERVHRALRHQRDVGQPQPRASLVGAATSTSTSASQHLAALDLPRRLDQAQDRQRRRGFARPDSPDQPEPLALVAG